jgi:hypothetical protein
MSLISKITLKVFCRCGWFVKSLWLVEWFPCEMKAEDDAGDRYADMHYFEDVFCR